MQLGRKLAEGYAVDIADEPEIEAPSEPVEDAVEVEAMAEPAQV